MKWIFLALLLCTGCSSLKTSHFETASKESQPTSTEVSNDDIPIALERRGMLLSWPLKGTIRFSRGYKLKGRRPHLGVDLAVHRGTPIYAAHDGYIEYAGKGFHGYGKLLILNSGKGWSSFYAHLFKMLVKEGQRIQRGDQIGLVGTTGNAKGPHLHFEIRYDREPVDPMQYLPPLE